MKVRYVQFESEAFLIDLDFIKMNAQERGVYCTLLFHLYCNNGRSELDPLTLARMCNCSDTDFEKVWQNIAKKFQTHDSVIKHKRVTKELNRAKKMLQSQRKAGLASVRKRLTDVATPVETPLQPSKDKESKEKKNKEKEIKEKETDGSLFSSTSFQTRLVGLSFDQQDRLRAKLAMEQAKKEFLASG